MKAKVALCAAFVVALLPAVARAEDAAKVKLTLRTHWKAGDTVTRIAEESEKNAYKVTGADGKVQDEGVTEKATNYTRVEKCLEADAAGHMTKGLVYFSEFAHVSGKDRDESLKGVTIEVTGTGANTKWKVQGDTVLEDAAKGWVEQDLGPSDSADEVSETVSPKAEVAAGDAWEFDAKAIAAFFGKSLPVDPATATGKAKLEGLDGDVATSQVEFEFQTKAFPSQTGALLPWAEGGKFAVKSRWVNKADGAPAPATQSVEFLWAGKAKLSEGLQAEVTNSGKKEAKTVAGGEIPKPPEPPKPPAPDNPPPDKPAPDKPAPDKPPPDKPEPEKPAPDKPEK